MALFCVLIASCKSTPPPPRNAAPPKPPASKTAGPEVGKEMTGAVRTANEGAGPAWKAEAASAVFGLTMERYRLGDGLELAFARDLASGAICYETWFGAQGHVDPLAFAAAVDLARALPGSESMKKLEAMGAIVGAGAVHDAGFFRVTIPSDKAER